MTKIGLLLAGLLLVSVTPQRAAAQALDPTFAPSGVYDPGTVYSAVEQPDGKRVVAGVFNRVNGTAASGVARFDAAGALDAPFQQNVGLASRGYRPRLLPNGQILLISIGGPITAGGLTRTSVLRLNANGTGDATLNAGTGATSNNNPIFVDDLLPLANGQMVVVGPFNGFNGAAAGRIVRLTPTGAVDPTFNAGSGADREIEIIVGLPNGQMLIGGYFDTYNGSPVNGLARLNADGSLDASFVTSFNSQSEAINLLVQPDGKILVAGAAFLTNGATNLGLVRLLPSGALDPGFSAPAGLQAYSTYSYFGDILQLQADGKILYGSNSGPTGSRGPQVGRLNANGSADPTYPALTTNSPPFSLTLLSNGRLLVGGNFSNAAGIANRTLVQLTGVGALDPSFQPFIQAAGLVNDVVRQADGKLVVGGSFLEIGSQAANGLARFNPNGTLDASFAPAPGVPGHRILDLALQPDGAVLAANGTAVVRYLSTGATDNTFNASALSGIPSRVLVQPDGRILVASFGSSSGVLVRLLANGAADASFSPTAAGPGSLSTVQTVELQANGKILVAGFYRPLAGGPEITTVVRLEANGVPDLSFTGSSFGGANSGSILNSLVVQPDGKVLVGGRFSAYGNTPRASVLRLNADGSLDASFVPPANNGTVNKLVLQPNNRVLLGGSFGGGGLPDNMARLLPNGAADASFGPTAVPDATVTSLLVQPDGAIVLGGFFATVGGQPRLALARITAPNVLPTAAPAAVAVRTEVWPVPAHDRLTVATDPTAHAQSIDLLDALGRTVRHQPFTNSATATMDIKTLTPGTYLLRVSYTEGSVLRRVQVR